jgi:hypothetical protein
VIPYGSGPPGLTAGTYVIWEYRRHAVPPPGYVPSERIGPAKPRGKHR